MSRSFASTLAVYSGGLLGLASRTLRRTPRASPGDIAMRRLTTYFIVPIWIGAGFLDYVWHRKSRIETTSGLEESLMHSLMMVEAAPAVLAGLFLEVNAGVIGGMTALAVAHELTVLWDLWFTVPRRTISAGEQVIHTFLEAPPFLVTAAAIATHWEQFLALLGRDGQRPRYDVRLQAPPISRSTLSIVFAAMVLLGALPHADELRRCYRAKQAGIVGRDTNPCLPEVFS